MSGTPDARPNTPTAPIGPFFGRSPSPHGGPSPSSSAAPHSHPPAVNAHLGLGTTERPIRPEDRREQRPGHGHLGQRERDGLRMGYDFRPLSCRDHGDHLGNPG